MSRILLAWELGTGFGHLGPFLGLAPRLLERGHELHIAAREIAGAVSAVGDLPIAVHQAPLCLNSYGGLQDPPLNYAEILMRYGYLDPAMLRAMIAAWSALLRMTRAELVMADHAPTALLAARLLGIPRAVIGSPFAVPPVAHPTPNMRAWMQVPPARLLDSDSRVLAAVNAALPAGAAPIPAIHEIFSEASRFFIGVPEIDPYGPRDPADYLGLATQGSGTAVPAWPAGAGKRVFVYMHADYRHFEAAARAIAASGARAVIHVMGADARTRQLLQSLGLGLSAERVDLRLALAEAELCITHGMGTTLAALHAGVPLLMLPKQLENYLYAAALQRIGAGIVVHPEEAAPDIAAALARVLGDGEYARNARAIAGRYREPSVATIGKQAVARIEAQAAALSGRRA